MQVVAASFVRRLNAYNKCSNDYCLAENVFYCRTFTIWLFLYNRQRIGGAQSNASSVNSQSLPRSCEIISLLNAERTIFSEFPLMMSTLTDIKVSQLVLLFKIPHLRLQYLAWFATTPVQFETYTSGTWHFLSLYVALILEFMIHYCCYLQINGIFLVLQFPSLCVHLNT